MNTITTLFKQTAIHEPSRELRLRILARIASEEQKTLIFWRRVALVSVVASTVVLSLGILWFGSALLQSEFWLLLSLVFSDLGTVLGASQDFLYSLLETLPIVPLIAFLTPLMVLFWSLGWYFSQKERPHRLSATLFAH